MTEEAKEPNTQKTKKPKKTNKAVSAIKWIASPGRPMPGLGNNFKEIARMRSKLKEWNAIQKERIELEKDKSFEDYMQEFEIKETDLPKIRNRFLLGARLYGLLTVISAIVSLHYSTTIPLVAFEAMFLTILCGSQFVLFSLRQTQVKHRELLGLDVWLSNPKEWLF